MSILGTCALLYLVNGNYNTYDIQHPPEGKQHAIINILSTKQDGKNWNCSAFVISDEIALTAGHCVQVDEMFKESFVYEEAMRQHKKEVAFIKAEIQKYVGCMTIYCANALNNLGMRLENLMTLKEKVEAKARNVDLFIVRNIYGQDTGIRATALYKNRDGRDHAILKGNFRDFQKIPVRKGFHVENGDKLRACGYAGSKTPPVCIDQYAVDNEGFLFRNFGYMVKGMSGGPVIDKYGFAVGINSKVGDGYVFMDTLVGIIDFKFERPEKEK